MKKNGEYVGVDEKFVPENEKYVDESLLGDKEKTRKTLKKVGIGYICFMGLLFIGIITLFIFGFMMFGKVFNRVDKSFDTFTDIQSDVKSQMSDTQNQLKDTSSSESSMEFQDEIYSKIKNFNN